MVSIINRKVGPDDREMDPELLHRPGDQSQIKGDISHCAQTKVSSFSLYEPRRSKQIKNFTVVPRATVVVATITMACYRGP